MEIGTADHANVEAKSYEAAAFGRKSPDVFEFPPVFDQCRQLQLSPVPTIDIVLAITPVEGLDDHVGQTILSKKTVG